MSLFRSIGGTIGVTVLGAILNGRIVLELATNLPSGSEIYMAGGNATGLEGILLSASASSVLPEPVIDAIRLSLDHSITYVFMLGAIITIFALGASALIRSVSLKNANEYGQPSAVGEPEPSG
jgi:hypothetical protein